MKKFLFSLIVGFCALSISAQEYVDMGLPSGTKWKNRTESGYYTYEQAIEKYGTGLPSKEQVIELRDKCKWIWGNNGCKVIGPNGNSIFLPANGVNRCTTKFISEGTYGCYWTRTKSPSEDDMAFHIHFCSVSPGVHIEYLCCL